MVNHTAHVEHTIGKHHLNTTHVSCISLNKWGNLWNICMMPAKIYLIVSARKLSMNSII